VVVNKVVLGLLALQAPTTEFEMCFNGECLKYMCDIGPSFTHEIGVTRIHIPCLPINIVCNDKPMELCKVDGRTIKQMPNRQGIIIIGD